MFRRNWGDNNFKDTTFSNILDDEITFINRFSSLYAPTTIFSLKKEKSDQKMETFKFKPLIKDGNTQV